MLWPFANGNKVVILYCINIDMIRILQTKERYDVRFGVERVLAQICRNHRLSAADLLFQHSILQKTARSPGNLTRINLWRPRSPIFVHPFGVPIESF